MNKEAINELADFIESAKFKFDMGEPDAAPTCGTAGCIGGHAAMLWPEVRAGERYNAIEKIEYFSWNEKQLIKKLGLAEGQEGQLCYLGSSRMTLCSITRAGAVTTLRRLAETGEVVWKREDQL